MGHTKSDPINQTIPITELINITKDSQKWLNNHLWTMTTCEQRPVWVVNYQSKSQFYQTPLSNGRFFQVPRVAVVHRLDCMLLRNIWDLFNLGQLDPIVRMYFACPKTIFMWEFLSRISFDSILCKCRLPRNSSMINRSV